MFQQKCSVSKTFSFNAALFACVCLASRFNNSPIHTFSLISIAFILFALWPEYRRDLQVSIYESKQSQVILNKNNFLNL